MTVASNPASRLHAVFAFVFDPEHSTQATAMGTLLGQAFEVQSPGGVVEHLSLCRAAVRDIRRQLDDAGMDPEMWVEPWWRQLSAFLDHMAAEGINVRRVDIEGGLAWMTPQSLAGLAMCGQYLSTITDRPELSDDEMVSLRQMLAELREAVIASDTVPKRLRAVLLDYLDGMDTALARVRILGPEGLAELLDQGLGAWVLEAERAKDAPGDESAEALGWWRDFLMKAARIVGFGRQAALAAGVTSEEAAELLGRTARAIEGGL